jgi:TRAP-type transport system periplasmic protein
MRGDHRRKLVTLAACVAVVVCVGLAADFAHAQPKSMKFKVAGVFAPPEVNSISATMLAWEEEITARTNGRITFENFWGAALGAPAEHLDLVKTGTVQVAQFTEQYQPKRLVVGDFEYVFPFGPTDYEIVAKATRQIRSEFKEFTTDYEKENVLIIADPPVATYNFISKVPLKNIADFQGKKVSLIGRFFGKWLPPGATAVVRPAGERYDLLRSGVVDADLLPFEYTYVLKLHELAKYFIKVDLTTCAGAPIVMNLTTFKGLSPEDQKIVIEAGKNAEMKAVKEFLPQLWAKCEKAWKDAGVQIIDFPAEEKKKWADSLEDTPAEWAAELEAMGYPGFKIVQRWQEITSEMGYKWPRKWGVKK